MYEVLIEKVKDNFRVLILDTFDGDKTVVDVLVNPMPWLWADGEKFICNEGSLPVVLHEKHRGVDFGKARKLESQIKKICEAL
jgi:hypothetical protein